MLFHRVDLPKLCIALFFFSFLAHFTQGTSTAPTPTLGPVNLTVATANRSINAATVQSPAILPTVVSDDKINKTAFSISASTTAPTLKPVRTTAKEKSKDSGRKFDGLSFFGGMILGAFICILLLFSVKYYQARKRSYHSL